MKTQLDITELLENFAADMDVMPSTRTQYYNVMCLFFRWVEMNGHNWRELGVSHIIKFKDRLFEDHKTNRTIRSYLVIIKIFFKWTERNGIYDNISTGIKLPKNNDSFSKKALTLDQVKQFLRAIDTSTQIGKRDYALFTLLFVTGLRSVSVESIDIGDMQIHEHVHVVWFKNKGSRQKDLFKALTPKCIDAIEAYLLTRDGFQDHWPLFANHSYHNPGQRLSRKSMRTIFKKRLMDIGISGPRYSLHSTRHTHGSISIQAVGAYQTQLSLGHASGVTTRIYSRHADEDIILKNEPGINIDARI